MHLCYSYNPRLYIPPFEVASNSWVCVREKFVTFSSLSPFGGSEAYQISNSLHFPLSLGEGRGEDSLPRHHISPFEDSQRQLGMCKGEGFFRFPATLPPIAYGLRPITYSSFFRLETSFLTFLALLYYIMNQLFIHPFYTNRPRFV